MPIPTIYECYKEAIDKPENISLLRRVYNYMIEFDVCIYIDQWVMGIMFDSLHQTNILLPYLHIHIITHQLQSYCGNIFEILRNAPIFS